MKSCAVLCVTIVARQILALSVAVLVLGHALGLKVQGIWNDSSY